MRTMNCYLTGLVLSSVLTVVVTGQDSRSAVRTGTPISARSNLRSLRDRQQQPRRPRQVIRNNSLVHRFEDLFPEKPTRQRTQPTPAPQQPRRQPQQARVAGQKPPGKPLQSNARPAAPSTPRGHISQDTDTNTVSWQLDEIEPAAGKPVEMPAVVARAAAAPGLLKSVPGMAIPMPAAAHHTATYGGRSGTHVVQVAGDENDRAHWQPATASRRTTPKTSWRPNVPAAPKLRSRTTRSQASTSRVTRPASLRNGLRKIPAQVAAKDWLPDDFDINAPIRATPPRKAQPRQLQTREPTVYTPSSRTASNRTPVPMGLIEEWRPTPLPAAPALAPAVPVSSAVESLNLAVPAPRDADSATRARTIPAQTVSSRRTIQPQPATQPKTAAPQFHPTVAAALRMTRQERQAAIAARGDLTGFKGFCPVGMRDNRILLDSQPYLFANYGNQTYYFSTPHARQRFLDNPQRYAPVAGGLDIVLLGKSSEEHSGRLDYCRWYRDELYLFSSEQTLSEFNTDPDAFLR